MTLFFHFACWIIGQYDPSNPKYLSYRAAVEANKLAWEAYLQHDCAGLRNNIEKLAASDRNKLRPLNGPPVTFDSFVADLRAQEFTGFLGHTILVPRTGHHFSASGDRTDNTIGHTKQNTKPNPLMLNTASTSIKGVSCWWEKKLLFCMLHSTFFRPMLTSTEHGYLRAYHDSLAGPSQ